MVDVNQLVAFWLVLARATAFIFSSPIFSIRNIPVLIKIGFAFTLTLLIFSNIKAGELLKGGLVGFILLALGEIGVGLALGIITSIIFSSIRLAGQLIDLQIGFAFSGIFDPSFGGQNTLMAEFMYLFGILLFLMVNGHHILINALAQSYQLIPLAGAAMKGAVIYKVVRLFAGMFALALQISAPILVVLVITDVTFGFIARTVPQINVFILGFPLKIGVGILTLVVLLPIMARILNSVFGLMEKGLYLLMESF